MYLFRGRENSLLIKRLRLSAAPRIPPVFWLRLTQSAAACFLGSPPGGRSRLRRLCRSSIRSPGPGRGLGAPIASKRQALSLPPPRERLCRRVARPAAKPAERWGDRRARREIGEGGEERPARTAGFAGPRPSGLPRLTEPGEGAEPLVGPRETGRPAGPRLLASRGARAAPRFRHGRALGGRRDFPGAGAPSNRAGADTAGERPSRGGRAGGLAG